jgi:Flp pilus assembly protein TadD
MTQFRLNFASLLVMATAAALLLAPAVHADALQDISKQIKQGQYPQALVQVDKYLADKPKDAQGRFLKGIILTEMNKPNEAIAIFTRLTEDYPELPEPYNNLAVIYAQQKQFDKARQALEMAIRTHPSYATAHENLGDIYARLASQSYDKALQIDSSNSSAQKKLALIRDLMSTSGRPGKTSKPIGEPRPAEPVKTAEAPKAAPAVPAAATRAGCGRHDSSHPPRQRRKPRPGPGRRCNHRSNAGHRTRGLRPGRARMSRPTSPRMPATSRPRPASRAHSGMRNGKSGSPNPAPSRSAWKTCASAWTARRRLRRFRQHYKSATLKTSSNKILQLGKREGKWLILQERVGG